MKIGIRKPSIKKSIRARTTGRLKREVKGAVNPFYGKKGMGLVNDPKKSIYNRIYDKTTVDSLSPIKNYIKKDTNSENNISVERQYPSVSVKERRKQLLESVPKEKRVGYWDKKASCCICEKDLSLKTLRSRLQLIDGWLCMNCLKKLGGITVIPPKSETVETLKSKIFN